MTTTARGGRMPKRVDRNHRDILSALRAVGVATIDLSQIGRGHPDALVVHRGIWHLIEIKGPRGKLTPAEAAWHAAWRGPAVAIVHSTEEALALVGAIEYATGED
jgi:hypothetical protein